MMEAFNSQYARFAMNKRKVSSKVVCRSASRRLVSKVLQLHNRKLDCSGIHHVHEQECQ